MADEEAEVSSKVGENANEGADNEQSGAAENLVVDATGSTKKDQPIAKQKIDLLLKATGDAPIMKQRKWAVEADRQIGSITIFMKKYLKMEPHESLFLYINQAFAPSPDQILRNLYECFGTDGKLVLHYCKSQAWG